MTQTYAEKLAKIRQYNGNRTLKRRALKRANQKNNEDKRGNYLTYHKKYYQNKKTLISPSTEDTLYMI